MSSKKPKLNPKLSEVYERLFELLDLSDHHKAQLNSRGMNAELIEMGGYKSLNRYRQAIVNTLVKEFETLEGVPGFWLPDDKGKNARWQMSGANGLLIPVRDHTGRIVQIKIRCDNPANPKTKYISLSSAKHPKGSSATANTHFPRFNTDHTVIRITEGELKADIATYLSGVYTVSCPGVNSWRKTADAILELNPDHIYVCFDSDKDGTKNVYNKEDPHSEKSEKPNDVGVFAGKLARYLLSQHGSVEIETWDEGKGKGVDDVLVEGHKTRFMTQEEKQSFIVEKLEGIIQFGWFYSGMSGMMHNYDELGEPLAMKRESWNLLYASEENTKPLERFMLDPASLKVHDTTYIPKSPQIIQKGNRKLFNSWAPSGVDPVEGDVTMLTNHIRKLLPNEEEAIVFERFLAWSIGREGEKILWIVLMQGSQGIGKTWFAELLKGCMGHWNVSMPENDEILSDYRTWAKEASIVIIDEFDAGAASNKRKVMDTFKPLITGNTARIREMYRNHYSVPNVFNMFGFTNHKDSVYLEDDDRRYYYVEAADPRIEDPRHHAKIWDWLREPATIPAVLWWAKNYDHSWMEENLTQMPPMTTAKSRLINENMHPVDQWVSEGIETHQHPFNRDVVCTSFLMQFVPPWVKGANVTNLGRSLAKHKSSQKEPRDIPFGSGRGKKRSVYYLRDADVYLSMKPKEISALLTGDEPILENESMQEYTDRVIGAYAKEKPNNPHNDDKPI